MLTFSALYVKRTVPWNSIFKQVLFSSFLGIVKFQRVSLDGSYGAAVVEGAAVGYLVKNKKPFKIQ
jgi:hypothetical protein